MTDNLGPRSSHPPNIGRNHRPESVCPYGKTTDCQFGRCRACVALPVRDQFPDLRAKAALAGEGARLQQQPRIFIESARERLHTGDGHGPCDAATARRARKRRTT